jgi:hypothetical protein
MIRNSLLELWSVMLDVVMERICYLFIVGRIHLLKVGKLFHTIVLILDATTPRRWLKYAPNKDLKLLLQTLLRFRKSYSLF